MLIYVLVAIFLCGYTSSHQNCDLPPSLWCSTPESAKRCKVLEQCEDFHTVQRNAQPVNVTLYHESLCPDCLAFITTSLWTAFTTVPGIFTLTSVPFGNAMETKDPVTHKYKFICQHGEEECVGNIIESCIVNLIKNDSLAFTYTHCIAEYLMSHESDVPKAAKTCAKQLNISYDQIDSCANGALGNQLEHQMALRTNALNPPHTYVPWVTINGVHTEEIQQKAEDNLVKLVCDTYQGPKPSACQQMHRKRTCLRKQF